MDVRVLLVDDHGLFRAGLASLLTAWGLEVVGQAENGDAAIALARNLRPDLIFMDINMPVRTGLEATKAIKTERPDSRIVMLTVSDDEEDLFEAIKSGAEGYLLKNLHEAEFAAFLEHIKRGEPAMSPTLASKVLREFARLKSPAARSEEPSALTEREREVLEQTARGATNKEIAAALFISENTVMYHLKNIMGKLHVRNRAQIVGWAMQHGFNPGKSE